MTTKKTPAKKTGTALQPWEERLAAKAQAAQESAKTAAGGSKSISTRNGQFTIDGAQTDPPNALNCIILDFCFETSYYADSFDPDNLQSPVAFALGRNEKTLEWHENSDPEFTGLVKDHEYAQWGSADKGKGKAVKELRRLIVIAEGDLDDLPNADKRMLKIPVTSGKQFDAYVKSLDAHKRPPCGVLTEISIVPDPKTQYKLKFKMLGLVEDDAMGEVLDLADSVEDELFHPYSRTEEEEAKPAKGAGKAQGRNATARKGRR